MTNTPRCVSNVYQTYGTLHLQAEHSGDVRSSEHLSSQLFTANCQSIASYLCSSSSEIPALHFEGILDLTFTLQTEIALIDLEATLTLP